MTKNRLAALIAAAVLLLGIAAGIIIPSRQNLKAAAENLTELTLDAKTDSDGSLPVEANGIFIGWIALGGELSGLENKICYDISAESGSASKSVCREISLRGGNAYVYIGQNADSIRLHPVFSDEGHGITTVKVNPRELVFSFTSIFVLGFGSLVVVGIILMLTLLRGTMSCYAEIAGKYRHLVTNLITRDLKVKYRRSVLGLLWSILNPLLMALVINAVFKNLFRFQIEYFIVYYLTGSLLFNFMVEATSSSLVSVIGASSLIKKVYIPKYIFPLEKCLFAFVNMLFSLVAVIIMIMIQGMPLHSTMLLFPIPLIYVFLFTLGLSLILASANVFFRDIGHLYSVWTTAWLYLTPIIYPIEILPDSLLALMRLNPMFYYVTYFRDVVMYNTIPDIQTNMICIVYALLFLATGLLVFKKKQDKFILYI